MAKACYTVRLFLEMCFSGTGLLNIDSETYQTRRDHLNRIIRPIPGFSMVTERRRVDLSESPEKATEVRVVHFFCGKFLVLISISETSTTVQRGLRYARRRSDAQTLAFVL